MFLKIVLFYTVTELAIVIGQDVTPHNITIGYIGHGATLHCQEGRPPFDWWYQASPTNAVQQVAMNGAVVVGFTDRFSTDSSQPSELVIHSVQYRDSGLYTCVEQAGLGPAKYRVQVDVRESDANPADKSVGLHDLVGTTAATEIVGGLSPGTIGGIVIIVILINFIIAVVVLILIYVLRKRRANEEVSPGKFLADLRGFFGLCQPTATSQDEESVPMKADVEPPTKKSKKRKKLKIPEWKNVAQVRRVFAPKSEIDPTINNFLPEHVVDDVLGKSLVRLVVKLVTKTPRADIKAVTTLTSTCQMWRRLVLRQQHSKHNKHWIQRHMNYVCAPYSRTAPHTASCLNLSSAVVGVAHHNNRIYVACEASNVIHLFSATPPYSVLSAPIIRLKTTQISDIVAWGALNAVIVGDLENERLINIPENGKWEYWLSPKKLDSAIKIAPCSLLTVDNKLIVVTRENILIVYGTDKKKLFKVQLDDKVDAFHAALMPSSSSTLSIYIRTDDDKKIVAFQPPSIEKIQCAFTGKKSRFCVVFNKDNTGLWCYIDMKAIFLEPLDTRKKRMLLNSEYGGLHEPKKLCLIDSGVLLVCDGCQVKIYNSLLKKVNVKDRSSLHSKSAEIGANSPIPLNAEAVKSKHKTDRQTVDTSSASHRTPALNSQPAVDSGINPAKVSSESQNYNSGASPDSKENTTTVKDNASGQQSSACNPQSSAPVNVNTMDNKKSMNTSADEVTPTAAVPVSKPSTSDINKEVKGAEGENESRNVIGSLFKKIRSSSTKPGKEESFGTAENRKKNNDGKEVPFSKPSADNTVLHAPTSIETTADEVPKAEAKKQTAAKPNSASNNSQPSTSQPSDKTRKDDQQPVMGLQNASSKTAAPDKSGANSSTHANKAAVQHADPKASSRTSHNSAASGTAQNMERQAEAPRSQDSGTNSNSGTIRQPPTIRTADVAKGNDITKVSTDVPIPRQQSSASTSQQQTSNTKEDKTQGRAKQGPPNLLQSS